MTVALITRTTSKVEHLGVWAYDRTSSAEFYDTGRYVPACAQERNHGSWSYVSGGPISLDPSIRRKPLCKRCQAALDEMFSLAESKEASRG